jgi:hypothetical protein
LGPRTKNNRLGNVKARPLRISCRHCQREAGGLASIMAFIAAGSSGLVFPDGTLIGHFNVLDSLS